MTLAILLAIALAAAPSVNAPCAPGGAVYIDPANGNMYVCSASWTSAGPWTETAWTLNLPTHVTGTLAIANGGTGQTTGAPGSLIGIQVLTASSGTYTPSAGTVTACIDLVAGGGGGGGCSSSAAAGAVGGGGAAGGYLLKCLTVSGSPTYTVGALGTAGASTGGTGGTGGDSTFVNGATTYTAKGGLGGVGETAGTSLAAVAGGAHGGVSTNGDVNGAGEPGSPAARLSGLIGLSGKGGSGRYGGGGVGLTAAGAGVAGAGKGSGGGGGCVLNNSGAVIGGVGTVGVIVVWEYR